MRLTAYLILQYLIVKQGFNNKSPAQPTDADTQTSPLLCLPISRNESNHLVSICHARVDWAREAVESSCAPSPDFLAGTTSQDWWIHFSLAVVSPSSPASTCSCRVVRKSPPIRARNSTARNLRTPYGGRPVTEHTSNAVSKLSTHPIMRGWPAWPHQFASWPS
jgi:hypothetical protein